MRSPLLPIVVSLTVLQLGAQETVTPPPEAVPGQPGQHDVAPQKLAWPRDRHRPVCRVGGKEHTLQDLLEYMDRNHYPGMLEFIEQPAGQLYFESPLPAHWVRQFADILALRARAESRNLDPKGDAARAALSASLKRSFESYLEGYQEARTRQGRPVELTQERINKLLTEYQSKNGLQTEVQGWLDFLVPEPTDDPAGRLRAYYEANVRYFGGRVAIAQILVEHRDPSSGELLTGKAKERAWAKLADIRARLKPDGSNFEDVARKLSDDRRTAAQGGQMSNIQRFDQRLPVALCRTAWQLEDGEISDPVESPYGLHIIKRLGYEHVYYVIYHEKLEPEIVSTMRQDAQEDLLFDARAKWRVELLY